MNRVMVTLLGVSAALVVTLWVAGLPLGPSLVNVGRGAFGGEIGWSRTLVSMTPLLLTGLGMVVAWRAGMFSIGGEGQYLIGALAGATAALVVARLPAGFGIALILAATAMGGALYAGLAAWLQIARGVQVVISTILLNFVAIEAVKWAVQGPLQRPGPMSLPETAAAPFMLPKLNGQTDLHAGVFLALFVAAAVAVWMQRTVGGFRTRLVGENPSAARAARVAVPRVQWAAMLISGALCGLAGGVQYLGIAGKVDSSFSQNWGFLAIPVALLGGLHPVGVVFSAFGFGALLAGTGQMARLSGIGGDTLVYVVQGVSVLAFVAFQRWADRREVRQGAVDG